MNDSIKQRQKKINRNSTIITLFGIVIICALSYWVIKSTSLSPDSRQHSERVVDTLHPLKLMAFQRVGANLSKPLDHLLKSGEKVVFKIASVKPLTVALAISIDEQSPLVAYEGTRIPPGPERLIANIQGPYEYTADDKSRSIRICVITGLDEQELNRHLSGLNKIWSLMPATSCVQLR